LSTLKRIARQLGSTEGAEILEAAAVDPDAHLAVGSGLNHPLLHHTVIGLEALEQMEMAGYWPDIEKSRAEARRLLKEAGAEGLTFELLNRNVDQPYKFNALWVIDEWSKIGVKVTQRVVPTGPFGEALRRGEFETVLDGDCQNIVNPLLDGTKYLPHSVSPSNYGYYEDPSEVELYDRMLRETDFARQRELMRQFEKLVLDTEAHEIFLLWRYRIVPYRSYVKGSKVSPSHYVNQDLATIWLDK